MNPQSTKALSPIVKSPWASAEVQSEPAIAAIIAQAPHAHVQRVGSRYWDAAATLGKILVSGNPEGTPLQSLLDNAVRGITQ